MIACGVTDLRKSAILRKSPASPASGSSIAAATSFSEQPSSSSQSIHGCRSPSASGFVLLIEATVISSP